MARRKQRRQAARRVDPAVARVRFRRWLPLPLAALVVALASFAFAQGIVTLPEPEFPIRMLKVEAAFERVSPEEIAGVVAPLVAQGFFTTDLGTVKEEIVALPWVRSVAVRRVWPDALHITVIEQRAVASWADKGLLNPDGELFSPAGPAPVAGLPRLEGPQRTSQQVMSQYQRLSARLEPVGLRIERLSMDPRRSWKLTLDNGMVLVLGRRDTEQQIERFARYWPGVMAARATEIAEIDLRYPTGFAVKWQPAASADAGAKKGTGDRV
jgi:cell division protein FtsQ